MDYYLTQTGLSGGAALGAWRWAAWRDLWTNTEAAAAVLIHDVMIHGVTQWTPNGGGDRVFVEARGVRVRNSVETVLWDAIIYLRNLNNDAATEESSQVGFLHTMEIVPYAAGDQHKIQVRVRSQRQDTAHRGTNNFLRFPASTASTDANHINTYRLKG